MKVIDKLYDRISFVRNAIHIEEIQKGYSKDQKFRLITKEGENYLLRIGSLETYERKQKEFSILQDLQTYGVKAPIPVDYGSLQDQNLGYSLYTFIGGVEAKDKIQELTLKEQYFCGVEAGIDLAKLHQYDPPHLVSSWYERTMNKHYRYLERYKTCGIKINGDEKIFEFIEQQKHHLKSRPNRLQHDDFQLGNLIVQDRKYAGVIDFNNFDWGDPFHDFYKLALFSSERSVSFSIGQIQGYFQEDIPDNFWRLYSIYVAMSQFSSIVWVLNNAPDETEEMIVRLARVRADHENFGKLKPAWFQENHSLEKGWNENKQQG
ncbi:aminoglycoside phosphotransferase family protein [Bacillus sp. 2205SS5-2]|uniref:aminoglycoside phosphotransferase family protein n=1 Tax=Bacillus sp. 2205SS5-2 TaxID=3109031 RepID=UPI0030064047